MEAFVWDGCTQADELSLEIVQLVAAGIVSMAMKNPLIANLYEVTGWETLAKRREHQKLSWMYKIVNRLTPGFLYDIVPPMVHRKNTYDMLSRLCITAIQCRTLSFSRSFFPFTFMLCNSLPVGIRHSENVSDFKNNLKKGRGLNSKQ